MTRTIPLLRLTLVLGLALGMSACETVSDAADDVGGAIGDTASALDPTGWFGDDEAAAPDTQMADAGAPPSVSNDTNMQTTPDLANLPARPATSTPGQQQAAAQSLAADGAQARYSADALRAGTEIAAPPPSALDAPPSALASADAPPSANDAPPSARDAPPPAARSATAAVPSASLSQGTEAVSGAASGARAPVQTAALPPSARPALPPGAEPAVPPNTPVRGPAIAAGSRSLSDAELGFQPSSAPPLDASINKWVPAPIVARYRQTASNSGVAMAAVPASDASAGVDGSVVANFSAVSGGPSGAIAAMNGGVAPTAVVMFAGDGTALTPAANQIRTAANQYKAGGGAGTVRVVGHASSRTPNMSVERHLQVIFEKSQARANAVAQELIRQGVPAAKVLVEAVGDSQPIYYESMPQGEAGNRRAEIYVQG